MVMYKVLGDHGFQGAGRSRSPTCWVITVARCSVVTVAGCSGETVVTCWHEVCLLQPHECSQLSRSHGVAACLRTEVRSVRIYCHRGWVEGFQISRSDSGLERVGARQHQRRLWPLPPARLRPFSRIRPGVPDGDPTICSTAATAAISIPRCTHASQTWREARSRPPRT
jgi:hypothetical protein